jgi:hypothetical protein
MAQVRVQREGVVLVIPLSAVVRPGFEARVQGGVRVDVELTMTKVHQEKGQIVHDVTACEIVI